MLLLYPYPWWAELWSTLRILWADCDPEPWWENMGTYGDHLRMLPLTRILWKTFHIFYGIGFGCELLLCVAVNGSFKARASWYFMIHDGETMNILAHWWNSPGVLIVEGKMTRSATCFWCFPVSLLNIFRTNPKTIKINLPKHPSSFQNTNVLHQR